jgi:GNAT superfamily N-acetyltransferase
MATQPLGILYAWRRGDPLPLLPSFEGFSAAPSEDDALLAQLASLSVDEVRARRAAGHRLYLARLGTDPVAYGWAATRAFEIGELSLQLELAPNTRYLWDFATLEPWRGRGVYPRLLQAILRTEDTAVQHFWIGHDVFNAASRQGIRAAGFQPAGHLVQLRDGSLSMQSAPDTDPTRAEAAARFLHVSRWPFSDSSTSA